jgi:hypothetical protein
MTYEVSFKVNQGERRDSILAEATNAEEAARWVRETFSGAEVTEVREVAR